MRILLAIAAVAIVAIAAAPAEAAKGCPDAATKHRTAVDLRSKGGLDCGVAVAIVRSYLRAVTDSDPNR